LEEDADDELDESLDDDDELEKVWKSEHSLSELTGDKEFKSYDKLKERLDKVLGLAGGEPVSKTTVEQIKEQVKSKPQTVKEPDLDEDDDMKYFERLASED